MTFNSLQNNLINGKDLFYRGSRVAQVSYLTFNGMEKTISGRMEGEFLTQKFNMQEFYINKK